MSSTTTRGRPDMIDESGNRRFIHPTEVKGRFHNRRVVVRAILMISLLILPWLKMRGNQAFLIDIAHRKFSFFGHLFFATDAPLLFLILINFVIGIAMTTAIFGRAWCGWACPQTVFIEGIFRRIERLIEGPAEERRKRDQGPMDFDRLLRLGVKWALFSVFTLWVTHSLLAIFIGSDKLLEIIHRPFGENPGSLIFILLSNLIFLADFGWFREQFCMIACPYGKFQSVLQDRFSVTVTYFQKRGEPRRGEVQPGETQGDCVDCNRCVKVCPTGIDIRHGNQLECIACSACIDACDDVMTRMGKAKGLIGYYSEAQINSEKQKILRPRIFIYSALITLFGSVAIYVFSHLEPFEVKFFKVKGNPYQVIQNEKGEKQVTNVFSAELSNKSDSVFQVTLVPILNDKIKLIMPNNSVQLMPGKVQSSPFTVEFDPSILELGSIDTTFKVEVENESTHEKWEHIEKIHLIGPF